VRFVLKIIGTETYRACEGKRKRNATQTKAAGLHCIPAASNRICLTMSAPPPAVDDFPIDGLLFPSLRYFIDANGGGAAFEGLTTDDVKDRFIVPQTLASQLSLCAQMKRAGDARVQPASRRRGFSATRGGTSFWTL
jgi:hypothetical protein